MDIRFTLTSLYVLIAAIVLGVVFNQYPILDTGLSAMFYDASRGGFYLNDNFFVQGIYLGVKFVVVATTLFIAYFALKMYQIKKSFHPMHYAKIIYFCLVIALGPGIVIHEVIKEHIDRPRPRHIEQFGGDKTFAPAFSFDLSPHDDDNGHSFVSGHSSVGFMFFAFAFLAQGALRKRLFINATLFGLVIGMGRIMQGGHFLSDVIFAGFTTYFVTLLVGVAMSKLFFPLKH